jgi:hypothetical protein
MAGCGPKAASAIRFEPEQARPWASADFGLRGICRSRREPYRLGTGHGPVEG